jgi:hypothetical protein
MRLAISRSLARTLSRLVRSTVMLWHGGLITSTGDLLQRLIGQRAYGRYVVGQHVAKTHFRIAANTGCHRVKKPCVSKANTGARTLPEMKSCSSRSPPVRLCSVIVTEGCAWGVGGCHGGTPR